MSTSKPEDNASRTTRQPGADVSEDAAGVRVRPVGYLVTIWPEGHDCPAAWSWFLLVTDRGHGQWAVEQEWSHGDKIVLTRSGHWHLDMRGDPARRFTLEEALQLARKHAATFTINGHAAADVMKAHLQRGCPR